MSVVTSDAPLPILYDLRYDLRPDLDEARRFLEALDRNPHARFGFGTKDDGGQPDLRLAVRAWGDLGWAVQLSGRRKGKEGSLLSLLDWRIARGAGVFVSIQALDGQGAGKANVARIRGFVADADGGEERQSLRRFIECSGLWPSILVASGGITSEGHRKIQAYWLVDDCPVGAFEAIQLQLLERTGTDPSAKDLARIFRLPGFYHTKRRDAPSMARILAIDGGRYTLADFTARMQAAPKQREIGAASGSRSAQGGHRTALGPSESGSGTGVPGDRLYTLLRGYGGIATPAVRKLINEARPPTDGAPGNRHPTLLAIVTRLAHDDWPDDSIRRLVLPQVHEQWGDGDWSAHLDRMLAWVREREARDPRNGPSNTATTTGGVT
jgi:hypothetical protein